ncbi:MAG: TonB-dependent receptor [Proteobacteria bacterium]|nr:TonB-dependent receptor [Pseudomonadota bacterium]
MSGFAVSTRAALAASAAIGLALPAVAFGQNAKPAAESGNEIIVTATKREQTLQSIPVAVSVTTAATIQQAQIRDLKDLSSVVPSLRVNTLQSSTQTNFIIRGFGNGANNAGIEPSVGVFIDGVYRSRSAAQIADFPDVKRVEVLEGPQSTLFGKNASAGVISIVTDEPKFRPGGSIEASYGSLNAMVVKSRINLPLSDTVAVSVASGFNKRDGYITNPITGKDINNRNRSFVRGQMLYQPNSQLKVRIIGDWSILNERCCAVENVQSSGPTAVIQALGGKVSDPTNPYGGVAYSNFDSTAKVINYGGSGQVDYNMGPVSLTSITSWRRVTSEDHQDSDFSSLDVLGYNNGNQKIDTFTQELRFATNLDGPLNLLGGAYYFHENIKVNNSIGWGNQARLYWNPLTGGGIGNTNQITFLEGTFAALQGLPASTYLGKFYQAGTGLVEAYTMKNDAYSLFGQADFKITPRLKLTAGLNYTHDKKDFGLNVTSNDVFSTIDITKVLTNFGIAQTVGGLLGVPGGVASPAQVAAFATANPAGYAAVVTGVNAAVPSNPLVGLKALQLFPQFLGVPNAIEPGKTSDGKISYTARLAYEFSKQITGYVSYATGYKASSINLSRDSRPALANSAAIIAGGLAVANQTYGTRFAGPEVSKVLEFGLKANWKIASMNMAVFKETIEGFQGNSFTGTGFVLTNAGKQSVFGIEFDGAVHPTSELTLTAAMTYLRPKYDLYVASAFGDLSGKTPAGISPITSTLAITNDHQMENGMHFIVRGDWHYESPTQVVDGLSGFIVGTNTAPALVAAQAFRREVSEFDASATLKMTNGLELTIWGRNISNNRYLGTVFDSVGQKGAVSGYPNQPRTWGGSILWRY